MKIAISSVGRDKKAQVSYISGKAPYYLIFKDMELEKVISNPFRFGGGGAGVGVAEMLSDEGVELIISGRFGDKMIEALNSRNIKYKELFDLTVREALEKIK
jgi:predicted Fe-Mo cluster-binding NifX family protein